MLLQGEEIHHVISEADYLCKQAVELRMKISERIFELERDELQTYRSEKSSSSKGTGRSHTSRVSSFYFKDENYERTCEKGIRDEIC